MSISKQRWIATGDPRDGTEVYDDEGNEVDPSDQLIATNRIVVIVRGGVVSDVDRDAEVRNFINKRKLEEISQRRTEMVRIARLEQKAGLYDQLMENNRIVVIVRGGVVSAIALHDPEKFEVLIADADNFDGWTPGDGYPMAGLADVMPLKGLSDVEDVSNMLRVFDAENPRCEQCGDEFAADDVVGGSFCSVTCEKRRWRE